MRTDSYEGPVLGRSSLPCSGFVRRRILAIGAAILFILVAGFIVLWPAIGKALITEALRSAHRSGARLSWRGLSVSGSSVQMESLESWVAGPPIAGGFRPPIQIELSQLIGSLSPLSLLTGKINGSFSARGYGGEIEASGRSLLSEPTIDATLTGVDLGQHPQLSALGLKSAVISGDIKDARFLPPPDAAGSFAIKVDKISLPSLPSLIDMASKGAGGVELSSILKLPPLENGVISLQGSVANGDVIIDSLRATSSIAGLDGSMRVHSSKESSRGTCQGDVTVSLEQATWANIGQWLPLITNNSVPATARSFVIHFSGTECRRPNASAREFMVAGMCIRATFEPR